MPDHPSTVDEQRAKMVRHFEKLIEDMLETSAAMIVAAGLDPDPQPADSNGIMQPSSELRDELVAAVSRVVDNPFVCLQRNRC